MSSAAVLSLLRTDPVAAAGAYGFIVEYDTSAFPHYLGGRCTLSIKKANDNVYVIKASRGTGDYFFPYTHIGGSAGRCQVPDTVPNGTLVLTGGMNGCALQVNDYPGYKIFYHDANGTQLGTEGALGGTVDCRVTYKDYEGPMKMGQVMASATNPYSFQTLISAKVGGRWLVVHTGILRSVKNKYSTYTSTITPLLTSFAG